MDTTDYTQGQQFRLDIDKVETLNDVKLILEFMDLYITPPSEEVFIRLKHLLKEIAPIVIASISTPDTQPTPDTIKIDLNKEDNG